MRATSSAAVPCVRRSHVGTGGASVPTTGAQGADCAPADGVVTGMEGVETGCVGVVVGVGVPVGRGVGVGVGVCVGVAVGVGVGLGVDVGDGLGDGAVTVRRALAGHWLCQQRLSSWSPGATSCGILTSWWTLPYWSAW